MLSILFLLPMFFVALVFENPNSPVLVFFTLFPHHQLLDGGVPMGRHGHPLLAAGGGLGPPGRGAAAAVVVIAPRVFRRGMLRYGKR